MLNMVEHETARIESRFLEPACGDGNFLIQILEKKFETIRTRTPANSLRYSRAIFLALTTLYGIDIIQNNVERCRQRLLERCNREYRHILRADSPELSNSLEVVLGLNIVHGDALRLTRADSNEAITFSEWTFVEGSNIIRRDYEFLTLLENQPIHGKNLFSDLGYDAFIPQPIKDFPPVHFLSLGTTKDWEI